MAPTKTKTKPRKVDFTASLGDERKRKFQLIARAHNRSMIGQLKTWIDEEKLKTEE